MHSVISLRTSEINLFDSSLMGCPKFVEKCTVIVLSTKIVCFFSRKYNHFVVCEIGALKQLKNRLKAFVWNIENLIICGNVLEWEATLNFIVI